MDELAKKPSFLALFPKLLTWLWISHRTILTMLKEIPNNNF